jgi:hypothetical protein
MMPDTSGDAQLARALAACGQFEDDVIPRDHDGRLRDHLGKPTDIAFQEFCMRRRLNKETGETPKPEGTRTKTKPDNSRTRAQKVKASLQQP